jgi:excisionase family DNA binding protein
MTSAAAAQYLAVPETSLRAALRRGEIPGAQILGRWRVRRVDLDALFVAAARPSPAATPDTRSPEVPAPAVVGEIAPPRRRGRKPKQRRASAEVRP